MKYIITILLLINTAFAKEIRIPKGSDGGIYKPSASKYNIQPGDTIILEGSYSYINLDSIRGTADKKIVIENRGQVFIGLNNSYGLIMYNSQHYILSGWGSGLRYGIKVGPNGGNYSAQGVGPYHSTDYEIRGLEIQHTQVGMLANPLSTPYTMKNIWIHHNWIHDINNPSEAGRCEAIYYGNTSRTTANAPGWFENILIEDNLCEDLFGDGIQVSCTKGYLIRRNIVQNYGKAKLAQQMTGILGGGNAYGIIADNLIQDGAGSGIQVFGYGYNEVRNNRLLNTSTELNNDGIYISKRGGTDVGPLQVDVSGNIINGAARNGIRHGANEPAHGLAGKWSNNIISNAIAGKYYSNVGDVISEGSTAPIPPAPAPVKKVMVIYDDGTWKWQ